MQEQSDGSQNELEHTTADMPYLDDWWWWIRIGLKIKQKATT